MNDHNDPNPNPLWIILDPLMDFFFFLDPVANRSVIEQAVQQY